ncbi:MAG: hypothetical protein EXS33_08090, partial [Pedosphaera sp.]|nr:hypothetical protein [Pedosphaera sp.]
MLRTAQMKTSRICPVRWSPLALLVAQGVLAAAGDPAPGLAEMVTSANDPRHLNLLLRANGGKIVLVNPPVDVRFTNNLNDGYSTD